MFEVATENTFEEYKTFLRAAIAASRASETKGFRIKRFVMLAIMEVVCIAFIVSLIWIYFTTKESWAVIMIAVMAFVETYSAFRVINYFRMFRTSKDEKFMRNMWENSVKMRGDKYTLTFDDECFSVVSPAFSANVKYDLVNKLIETKTHFYLLTGINQGFIADKGGLTKEQCLFIRAHCSSEEKPQIIL